MACRMLSLTVAGVLALGGISSATTKTTPALSKNSGDSFVCRVANASPDTIEAQVQIIGSNSVVLKTDNLNAPAGWTASSVYTGTAPIGYCVVDGSFPRRRVLVTFCVNTSGSLLCESPVGDPGL